MCFYLFVITRSFVPSMWFGPCSTEQRKSAPFPTHPHTPVPNQVIDRSCWFDLGLGELNTKTLAPSVHSNLMCRQRVIIVLRPQIATCVAAVCGCGRVGNEFFMRIILHPSSTHPIQTHLPRVRGRKGVRGTSVRGNGGLLVIAF